MEAGALGWGWGHSSLKRQNSSKKQNQNPPEESLPGCVIVCRSMFSQLPDSLFSWWMNSSRNSTLVILGSSVYFLNPMTTIDHQIKSKCVCSVVSDSLQPFGLAHQVPLSKGLFRQDYWSELPFPPPGDLPNPGIKPLSSLSPALQVDSVQWYRICLPMQETQEMQVWSLGQRDSPGGGNGNSLQYSYQDHLMERGAWQAVVHGVAKSQIRLSNQVSFAC